MLRVLTNPLRPGFIEHCSKANSSISLCAPFVKKDVIDEIISVKRETASISLITKISLESFHRKASDFEALHTILSNNGDVHNVSNLHAKIFIFDNSVCYISSANLTSSGLERNYEYGIYSDDEIFVNSVVHDYAKLISDKQTGIIKLEHIHEINKILNSIPTMKKVHYPKLRLELEDGKSSIRTNLQGWKLAVFNALDSLENPEFDTTISNQIAEQLGILYPENNNRQAKVRQVLQQLRDIGLVQFDSPGKYIKLWE